MRSERRQVMGTERVGLILAFLSPYKGAPVQGPQELIMYLRTLAKLSRRELFYQGQINQREKKTSVSLEFQF